MLNMNLQLLASKKGVGSSKNGRDSIFALVDGAVKFERKDKKRKKVSVYPVSIAE